MSTDNFDWLTIGYERKYFNNNIFTNNLSKMYPPMKRFRMNESDTEADEERTTESVMNDFEMTDDELLFSATQVEQHDYYQVQSVSQNPSRTYLQTPTQTILQPIAANNNRTQILNKEFELERKLLMKEGQIIILEKNNRLLSEKNARL